MRETLILCAPYPDGMVPIDVSKTASGAERDNLGNLLFKLGFDYIADDQKLLDETRGKLDTEGLGKVHIDQLQEYVSGLLNEILDPERLRAAFNQFDADGDNMLSLDEFDFFMDGFAKEHNRLRDSQLVKQMVSIAKENVEKGTDKFTIDKMIMALRKVWKMPY